jgi:RNA recognition motif-containing protein
MSSRLFIGNLDFSAQEDELREMFAPFGAIASLSVVLDRETGRARGFGFVERPSSGPRRTDRW